MLLILYDFMARWEPDHLVHPRLASQAMCRRTANGFLLNVDPMYKLGTKPVRTEAQKSEPNQIPKFGRKHVAHCCILALCVVCWPAVSALIVPP